jgi:hypothetical protein
MSEEQAQTPTSVEGGEQVAEEVNHESEAHNADEAHNVEALAQKLSETETALNRLKVEYEFYRAAMGRGFVDVEKLIPYLDFSKITVDEDGAVQGIDEMLDALNVLKTSKQQPRKIGEPVGEKKDKSAEQMLQEAAEKARRTGRLEDRAAYAALKQKLKQLTGGR